MIGTSSTISRRVRFSLPGHDNNSRSSSVSTDYLNLNHAVTPPSKYPYQRQSNDMGKVHGTTTYVNGTLMTVENRKASTKHEQNQLHHVPKAELKSCIKEMPKMKKLYKSSRNDDRKPLIVHPQLELSGTTTLPTAAHQANQLPPTQPVRSQIKLRPATVKTCSVIFSPATYVKTFRNRSGCEPSPPKSNSYEPIPDLLTLPNILESHDRDCSHCSDDIEVERHRWNDTNDNDDDDTDADIDDDVLFPNFENLKIVDDRPKCASPTRDFRRLPDKGDVFATNEQNYSNFMALVDQWREQKRKNRKYQLSSFLRRRSPMRTIPKLPPIKRNSLR